MRAFAWMASACVLALGGQALAEPVHTEAELKALPPAEAARTVASDLSALLQSQPNQTTRFGGRRSGVPSVVTPAYGTGFAGLCERDQVIVHYAPVTTEGKPEDRPPEDRPMKAYGVETRAFFADIGITGATIAGNFVVSPACQALDGKADADWFPAQDSWQAGEALLLLKAIRAQLQTGQPAWPACDAKCKDDILAPSHIFKVIDCAAPEAEAKGALCYEIWTDRNISINIKLKRSATLPGDIESVTAGTLVIVD